jgi:hypothetical protein
MVWKIKALRFAVRLMYIKPFDLMGMMRKQALRLCFSSIQMPYWLTRALMGFALNAKARQLR